MEFFESARLRVERARQHANEMSEAWNTYLKPHPFEFELVRDSDRTYLLRVEQIEPTPLLLPALFGEWLFNLRSALDHIVWASAVHSSGRMPPPGEGGLQYPIYDEATGWDRNAWRLRPLAAHQLEMLHTMQPFNSDPDANYLGWINRLARIDRHRRLNGWTARVAVAEPVLAVPSRVSPRLEWGRRTFVDERCDFARVTFPDRSSADGVTFNPRVGIDPEISEWGESPFWSRIRFSERLHIMSVFVAAEIDVYDFDCTGSAKARRSVAESFASESDARRAAGMFPNITYEEQAPATWTEAVGRTSTPDRYFGRDFPPHGSGEATTEEHSE